MRFCENIRRLRKEKSLTQQELSQILCKTKTTICDWERDKVEPDIDMLITLGDLFECSIDYLLGREDDVGNIEVNKELSADEKAILAVFNKVDEKSKSTFKRVVAAFLD